MRSFSEIIDQRRKDLGITVEQVQEQLERLLHSKGLKAPAVATVGHWFNGTRKRPRDMDQLRGLCDVLGLEVGEAMGGEAASPKTALEQLILQKTQTLSVKDQEILLALISRFDPSKGA